MCRFNNLLNTLSSTSKYHLGKAAYVINLIGGMKKEGVDVQRLINKCSLRYFKLDDPESMIPIPVMYEFFELAQNDQGIDKMGVKFQKLFSLETIGAYGDLLSSSKKILPAILYTLKYEKLNLTHDNCEFKFLDGKTAFYGNRYSTAPSKGQDFLNAIDHSIQMEFLKNANEEGWSPLEIHLRDDDVSIIEKIFPNCKSKILVNQEKYGFIFKTEMLSNALLSDKKYEIMAKNIIPGPKTLSGKIENMFDDLSTKYLPGISEVASMFDTSVSSIKRSLQEEDVSFSVLLERWRFMKGVEILTKTDLKINEISDRLFYNNPSNFIRAFKRTTGFSPNSFRD